MSTHYRIGELGQVAGVNQETIRYYEKIGLLPSPGRSPSGYRHYDEKAAKQLRFIRRGRELGFSIEEIRTLLQLAAHPEQPCGEADSLTRQHLAEVEAKIADLMAIRDALSKLSHCPSQTTEHCRLIEALDQRHCCTD
ncbi:MerR family transcriptional regulator [Chitinimonas sp. BJB300]|uniref:MerR family transcriptional regulator n=1 Tax=Chitinimonas sp. BJB300 TaxID=1559339 RepID=UPI000C0EE899|nr:helix-turn-helix domain-containing protein [Chitinimonas sp. BJB300]PHV10003.1 MerR family transcriptional regulator [Chitinimonas sp. BJB300]TSJ83841.1 helix-turn-helix domain-containing protein [Chitinimonas sp. BJB300]